MYCQKCRTPLKRRQSLEDLNENAFKLLTEASGVKSNHDVPSPNKEPPLLYSQEQKHRYDLAVQDPTHPSLKRAITAPAPGPHQDQHTLAHGSTSPAMSFIMLTESQFVPPKSADRATEASVGDHGSVIKRQSDFYQPGADEEESLYTRKMESTTRLFALLSARSDVDHPVCTDCTDMIVEGMERRLQNSTKERDAYLKWLKSPNAELPTEEERTQAQEQLKALLAQEQAAMTELEELEAQKATLDAELTTLGSQYWQLKGEEEQFWKDRNAFVDRLTQHQRSKDRVSRGYDHDSDQLEMLSRTNVYNDTFCISHNAQGFATINDLRLGRRNGASVPWPEINAAWGTALLLLATVAEKLDYTFQGFKLHPLGSTSTIERLDASAATPSQPSKTTSTHLNLFYSSELSTTFGFFQKHFDNAMVAFLECLRQLGQHVQRTTAPQALVDFSSVVTHGDSIRTGQGLKMSWDIKKDKIGDASIRLPTFDDYEGWNTACKRVLTSCKFLLAHTSVVSSQRKSIS